MMLRRDFLTNLSTGLSGVALASLLHEDRLLAADPIRPRIDPAHPYEPREPHFPAKAKNVLVIFCSGACSQLDTFDYKPELIKQHGQPMPGGETLRTFQAEQGALHQSPWKFKPRGQSGKMVTELVPHLGALADQMCFIHSMTSKTNTHGPGENFMSTGYILDGFPSMGAWISYALGSESRDLPAYVAVPDPRGAPQSSVNNWGPGFFPPRFREPTLTPQVRYATSPGLRESPPKRTAPLASSSAASTMPFNSAFRATLNWPPASPATNWRRRCN